MSLNQTLNPQLRQDLELLKTYLLRMSSLTYCSGRVVSFETIFATPIKKDYIYYIHVNKYTQTYICNMKNQSKRGYSIETVMWHEGV